MKPNNIENLSSKFDRLFSRISDKDFLSTNSNSGGTPIFISTYNAKQEIQMRDSIELLIQKLSNHGIEILEINLFNICCDLLEKNIGMESMFKFEKIGGGSKRLLKALQSSLNTQEVLLPEIREVIKSSNAQAYFLTGIGLVFPFIRFYNIYSSLESIAKKSPILAFFPGDYNGHTLNLFGLLKENQYYVAYNIIK